jgi:hypothetical protein
MASDSPPKPPRVSTKADRDEENRVALAHLATELDACRAMLATLLMDRFTNPPLSDPQILYYAKLIADTFALHQSNLGLRSQTEAMRERAAHVEHVTVNWLRAAARSVEMRQRRPSDQN